MYWASHHYTARLVADSTGSAVRTSKSRNGLQLACIRWQVPAPGTSEVNFSGVTTCSLPFRNLTTGSCRPIHLHSQARYVACWLRLLTMISGNNTAINNKHAKEGQRKGTIQQACRSMKWKVCVFTKYYWSVLYTAQGPVKDPCLYSHDD